MSHDETIADIKGRLAEASALQEAHQILRKLAGPADVACAGHGLPAMVLAHAHILAFTLMAVPADLRSEVTSDVCVLVKRLVVDGHL